MPRASRAKDASGTQVLDAPAPMPTERTDGVPGDAATGDAPTTAGRVDADAPIDPDDLAELATALRLAVGRLNRQLRRNASEGLSAGQLSALAMLRSRGPMRLGDLAWAEGIAPPTLSRIAARLEDLGLVERTVDPDDRRAAVLSVTAAGAAEGERIRQARTALIRQRIERLGPADRATLAGAMPLLRRLSVEEA